MIFDRVRRRIIEIAQNHLIMVLTPVVGRIILMGDAQKYGQDKRKREKC